MSDYINEPDIVLPCGHRGWTWYGWKQDGRGGMCLVVSLESHVAKKCYRCGAWLSLGEAEDDEWTAVEVRAAGIAADWERFTDGWHGFVSLGSLSPNAEHMPHIERGMMRPAPTHYQRDIDDYWAGWLAREIHEHDAHLDRIWPPGCQRPAHGRDGEG